jgi:tetratricopeptide (TPR) repeat protein
VIRSEDRAFSLFRAAYSAKQFADVAASYAVTARGYHRLRIWSAEVQAYYFAGRANFHAGRPDSAFHYFRLALATLGGPHEQPGFLVRMLLRSAPEASDKLPDSLMRKAVLREIGRTYLAVARPDSALAFTRLGRGSCFDRQALDPNIDYDLAIDSVTHHTAANYPMFYCPGARSDHSSRDQVPIGSLPDYGPDHVLVAYALLDLGQPDSALIEFRLAMPPEWRAPGGVMAKISRGMARVASGLIGAGPYFALEGQIRTGMGEAFLRLGLRDSAAFNYDRLIDVLHADSRFFKTPDRQTLARALVGSANVFRADGKPDSARRRLEDAIKTARTGGALGVEAIALQAMARLYREGSAGDRARALAYFDSASYVRTLSRLRAPGDENRLRIAERYSTIEQEWALTWLSIEGRSDRERALGSLAAVERGRARALLDLLHDSTLVSVVPPGANMIAEGESLVSAIAKHRLGAVAFLASRDTLMKWSVDSSGAIRVQLRALTSDSVMALVLELRRQLRVDGPNSRAIDAESRSAEAADSSSLAAREDTAPWRPATRTLAAAVLDRSDLATARGRELLVVPSGALNLVPFTLLLDEIEPLQVQPVRYAPSLSIGGRLLGEGGRTRIVDWRAGALIVGNPEMPAIPVAGGTKRLPSLPGTEKEARWLGTRLHAEPLLGRQATRANVLNHIGRAGIVHFATHGFAFSSVEQARSSFVALAPEGEDSGLLTVGDLIDDPRANMAADLVTFSACQTGLGFLSNAEGVQGLERAVLARGARAALVSLWSVSDGATLRLMQGFYEHWLGDAPDAAAALQRAQQELRAVRGYAHPRYWAAFKLVGGS